MEALPHLYLCLLPLPLPPFLLLLQEVACHQVLREPRCLRPRLAGSGSQLLQHTHATGAGKTGPGARRRRGRWPGSGRRRIGGVDRAALLRRQHTGWRRERVRASPTTAALPSLLASLLCPGSGRCCRDGSAERGTAAPSLLGGTPSASSGAWRSSPLVPAATGATPWRPLPLAGIAGAARGASPGAPRLRPPLPPLPAVVPPLGALAVPPRCSPSPPPCWPARRPTSASSCPLSLSSRSRSFSCSSDPASFIRCIRPLSALYLRRRSAAAAARWEIWLAAGS